MLLLTTCPKEPEVLKPRCKRKANPSVVRAVEQIDGRNQIEFHSVSSKIRRDLYLSQTYLIFKKNVFFFFSLFDRFPAAQVASHRSVLLTSSPMALLSNAATVPPYNLSKNQQANEENMGLFAASASGTVNDMRRLLKLGANVSSVKASKSIG